MCIPENFRIGGEGCVNFPKPKTFEELQKELDDIKKNNKLNKEYYNQDFCECWTRCPTCGKKYGPINNNPKWQAK